MSGVMEALADSNGGANIVAANNNATSAPIGTCGSTMTATRTARATSQNSITERHARPEQAADHPRQIASRVDQGGEQRRRRLVVYQQGEGDQGQTVTHRGQGYRRPQEPELAHREHVAERGTRRHSALSRCPEDRAPFVRVPGRQSASS